MPKAIEKWFTDVRHACIAMEAETHSIWTSEQLQELGHEVIVVSLKLAVFDAHHSHPSTSH
jgi:transposase